MVPVNLKIVDANVQMEYDSRAEAFGKSPTADNWRHLLTSMHALQFWRGLLPADKANVAASLWPKPMGEWPGFLKQEQEERFKN